MGNMYVNIYMKPKIALLISGRATCWEHCLLPVLKNSVEYDIDLFMSINSNAPDCKYFTIMKNALSPYLKNIYIGEYTVPTDFINTSTHIHTVKQLVNDKYVPLNVLSMWFNYKNAFEMACNYEKLHNFAYDFFMTFRSDIIIGKIPRFNTVQDNILYSVNQPCQFISFGIHKAPIVSPEWVFAKKNTLALYLETYNFIMEMSKIDNNYICHYESNATDNCIEKKLNVVRINNIEYAVDANRRRFDDWNTRKDTRVHNIANRDTDYIDIHTVDEKLLLKIQRKN
jgi:hypothetical protein